MRQTIGAWILLTIFGVAPSFGQVSLDVPVDSFVMPSLDGGCSAVSALRLLARSARLALGVERPARCIDHEDLQSTADGPLLRGRTSRQLLDAIVAASPEFSWREVSGIPVVRPRVSWTDETSSLNLRIAPSNIIERSNAAAALGALLDVPVQPAGSASDTINRQIDVTFDGGRVLDGLNAIVRAHGESFWDAVTVSNGSAQLFFVNIFCFDKSAYQLVVPMNRLKRQRP